MLNRADPIKAAASASQLWRLNQLRCLAIVEIRRHEPIPRDVAKQFLGEAVERGLWTPEPRRRDQESKRK